jgi:hypothetical protein
MNISKLCKFIKFTHRMEAANLLAKVSESAQEIYKENQGTKKLLLQQIQMFEGLLEDKSGREVAYRRIHYINNLIRDIQDYTQTPYNKDFDKIIIGLPEGICEGTRFL